MDVRIRLEERVAQKLKDMSLPYGHEHVVDHINRVLSRHEFLRQLSLCIDEALSQVYVDAALEASTKEDSHE